MNSWPGAPWGTSLSLLSRMYSLVLDIGGPQEIVPVVVVLLEQTWVVTYTEACNDKNKGVTNTDNPAEYDSCSRLQVAFDMGRVVPET